MGASAAFSSGSPGMSCGEHRLPPAAGIPHIKAADICVKSSAGAFGPGDLAAHQDRQEPTRPAAVGRLSGQSMGPRASRPPVRELRHGCRAKRRRFAQFGSKSGLSSIEFRPTAWRVVEERFRPRHRERSEAIQTTFQAKNGGVWARCGAVSGSPRRFAPRNDDDVPVFQQPA